MKKLLLLSAAPLAALTATPAAAEIIDFENLPGSNGDAFTGPYVEDGFTVRAAGGDVFEGHQFGNGEPSLVFGSVFGGGFGAISITGGTFTFDGYDVNSFDGTADFSIQGFLGGVSVFNLTGIQSETGLSFASLGGAAGTIDELNFIFTPGGSSVNIDNIVLNSVAGAVPEPGTWLMMILGFGAIGGAMRSSRKVQTRVTYA
jgi:hypothetical protein